MEKEKRESLLIDYIDGTLPDAERAIVETELTSNPDAIKTLHELRKVMGIMAQSKAVTPPASFHSQFNDLINNELYEGKNRQIVPWWQSGYKMAASVALVAMLGLMAFWAHRSYRQSIELQAMKAEMDSTRGLIKQMLASQYSAGTRLTGIAVANKVSNADDEILSALVTTFEQDGNINVRLAALDALAKFHRQPVVRRALIGGLKSQADPSIQIALIRVLTEMKETEILKELKRISESEEVLPSVKDEAHASIMKLS